MTYEEWAATVERGVTINPEMAFEAGAASRDAEIAELKDALGYDWDKYKASQMALRECMQMVVEQDAEIAELVEALERIVHYYDLAKTGSSLPSLTMQARADHENTMFGAARAALAKVSARSK